jgi:hypothetical protein
MAVWNLPGDCEFLPRPPLELEDTVGVVETVASLIRVTLITPAVTTRGPGNATRKYRRTSFRHVASCTYSSCVQLDPSPRRAEVLESPRTGGSAEPVKPGAAVQRERAPRSGTGAGRLLRPFSLALARAALRHRVPAHVYDARTMPGSGCGRSRSPGWLWSPRPWSVWALRSPSAPVVAANRYLMRRDKGHALVYEHH